MGETKDLYILLPDNVIDACAALPVQDRLFRVYMDIKGNYLYLSLLNMAQGKKRHEFGTTKGDGHGFGISRIDALVKKYNGYIKRASEDGAFSTEVLLPR